MSESISPSVESLLEHAGWIRALAARLVQDPQGADDVAQDAWIAASTGTPRGSLRAWLAAIVANGARARRRSDLRRAQREESAARAEAEPSTHDLVERAELQRRLVEAVLELDEPYRTAILLRFFEEREPHEIARLLNVPDATVRTHVARGLARLRARLDRGTDRAAWSAVLVPAAFHHSPVPASLIGALIVNTPVKIGLVAAGIAAVVLFVTRASTSGEAHSLATAASTTTPTVPAERNSTALAGSAAQGSERSAVAPDAPSASAAHASTASDVSLLYGRVLDMLGAARSGVPVMLRSRETHTTVARVVSDAAGEFAMERGRERGLITADDPALVTLFAGLVDGSPSSVPVVVVAPATKLSGFVVDAQGVAVDNALVRVECPEELRTHIPQNLDFSQAQDWSAQSDAQGRYDFAALPRIPEARLHCTHEGFVPFDIPLGDALGGTFVITLVRPGAEEKVVRGRVVDMDGSPVEKAWVSLGIETVKSDEHGGFALKLDDPAGVNAQLHVDAARLVATKKGFLPGEFQPPMSAGRPVWPQSVTLRLGTTALSISGTVTDHLGHARAGMRVFVADPTLFGVVDDRVAQIENVLAGKTDRTWSFVETDAEGRFVIEGLCARAYTVRAMEPETLLRIDEKDVVAGTKGLAIAMPRDALYPRVAGRVRTHDGKPIAGAHIFPMCDAFQARMNGQIVGTSHDALDGVTTDADGRFEITDVPKTLVYLRVEREDVLPLEYGRFVEGDERFTDSIRELPRDHIEDLDIRVDRRAHMQVELADSALADEFALLDENNKPLEVSVFIGNGRREGHKSPIVDGKSYVTAGTDRAKTIVLYKSGAESARRPVALVAGETTTVRF